MVQARVNSPLWDEYVEKDIVGRDEEGKIILHERFEGETNFNHISYTREWEELTRIMGYWVNMDDPYITYDNRNIETVWWLLKQIYSKGLIIVPFHINRKS